MEVIYLILVSIAAIIPLILLAKRIFIIEKLSNMLKKVQNWFTLMILYFMTLIEHGALDGITIYIPVDLKIFTGCL